MRAFGAPLRLGNHSALLARELHYWNLKLQIGHIRHSKNLTTRGHRDSEGNRTQGDAGRSAIYN